MDFLPALSEYKRALEKMGFSDSEVIEELNNLNSFFDSMPYWLETIIRDLLLSQGRDDIQTSMDGIILLAGEMNKKPLAPDKIDLSNDHMNEQMSDVVNLILDQLPQSAKLELCKQADKDATMPSYRELGRDAQSIDEIINSMAFQYIWKQIGEQLVK